MGWTVNDNLQKRTHSECVFDSEHFPEIGIFKQMIFENIWCRSDLDLRPRNRVVDVCPELQQSCKFGEITQTI